LINMLRVYHPDIRLFHQVTPLFGSIVTGLSSSDKIVAIYYYSNFLDITIVQKKEMLFYNTFQINAPEDSVYYLAGVLNMFDLDMSSTKLIYAGNFKQAPPEIAILKKYVDSIIECDPPHTVTYSYHIQASVRKNFSNLFNLYGCEL